MSELFLKELARFNDTLFIRCRSYFLSFSYHLTRIFLLSVWCFFTKCIMCIISVTVRFWSPGPLLLAWIIFISAWIRLCIPDRVGLKLHIHSQTSMVALLNVVIWWLISSRMYNWCHYLYIVVALNLINVSRYKEWLCDYYHVWIQLCQAASVVLITQNRFIILLVQLPVSMTTRPQL